MSNVMNDCRIDYIELPATDVDATRRFYAEAFGWRFTDWGSDYTAFEDGRLRGGFWKTDAMKPAKGVLVVLYSDDFEGTMANVRRAGGKIVNPHFTFPGGRRFHFLDPSGNELAVWSLEAAT